MVLKSRKFSDKFSQMFQGKLAADRTVIFINGSRKLKTGRLLAWVAGEVKWVFHF